MSLYSQLFGFNDYAPLLLKCLGIDVNTIPRFRDAQIHNGKIVILTRTGGPNREDHAEANTALAAHPLCLFMRDMEFDPTYAYFFFKFPDDLAPAMKFLEIHSTPEQLELPHVKWERLLSSLKDGKKTPETERALEVGSRIVKQINDATGPTVGLFDSDKKL